MLIIGLVGGVACGKSRIARFFEGLGAIVLDGDLVGHQVLMFPRIKTAIQQKWGNAVVVDDQIDRGQLAKVVFENSPNGKSNLRFLEQLVHPEIKLELIRQINEAKQRGIAIAILDAPVLIKAGWDSFCNELLFVDVPVDLREKRAIERGWTKEMFAQRERAQTSLDIKKQKSTCVLDNSGEWKATEIQATALWKNWLKSEVENP